MLSKCPLWERVHMSRHRGLTTSTFSHCSYSRARVMNAGDLAAAAKSHTMKLDKLLQKDLFKDKKHPIYNFLFTYVFINPKNLFTYSPGIDTVVTGISYQDFCADRRFSPTPAEHEMNTEVHSQWNLTPPAGHYSHKQLASFTNTLEMLRKVQIRPPMLHCFGLHEWAMLYRRLPTAPSSSETSKENDSFIRKSPKTNATKRETCDKRPKENFLSKFQLLPLRVSPAVIAGLLESKPLRCTHFDAFRFFTSDATPLNRVSPPPSRAGVANTEQPGCVHVTMDLFKWAIKLHPYCPSELIFDCLQLAISAREVDMRASPYDLTAYRRADSCSNEAVDCGELGLGMSSKPIRVETAEGRKEYQLHQERLYREARDIRDILMHYYSQVLRHQAAGASS